jgi:pre-rRNA-processing protein TSR3
MTRQPSRNPGVRGSIPLTVYYTAQDDPKKNTAVRMERKRLIRIVNDTKHIRDHMVLLNPFAKKAISREDLPTMQKFGLLGLDCSWKQAEAMFPILQGKVRSRALPFLVAASPARFGTPFELSTAEAIAAALYIVGEERHARRVMSVVPWGKTFFDINENPLKDYAACETSAEVVEAQMAYLGDEEE